MTDGLLPTLQQQIDAAPCGLLVVAADGRILQGNATFCRWLQVEPAELLAGPKLAALMTTGSRMFLHTHLQPLLRMQGSVAEVKLEVRRKDGVLLPMIFNIAEHAWQGATLWQVAAFVAEDRHKYERELLAQRRRAEELTERFARAQEELAAARRQAEDRALLAEQMVGVVSHDIRNPLSVIQMSTTLLEHGLPPARQAEVVARIGRAATRMQNLVSDLLDFTQARLGSGLRVQPVELDAHRLVADTVAELAPAFPGRALACHAQGPPRGRADPQRIAQAIGNLVSNAIHHGEAQQPVTVASIGGPAGFRISVHNHGRPIPADKQPELFEAMVRGESVTSSGVGLGLYIVRSIAEGHGGRVEVASSAEAGTTFTLVLPPPAG